MNRADEGRRSFTTNSQPHNTRNPIPMTPEPEPSNQFLSALQRHRGGALLNEASEHLAEVVASVLASGKPGSLVIKLDVKPAQKGHNAVVLTGKSEPKLAKVEVEASFWFADEDGSLCKTDPRQRELPLKAVQGGQVETPEAWPAVDPRSVAANP